MVARPAIIPGLIYEDAERGIAFLCDAFGFQRHLVVPGDASGQIAHAQLVLDGGMVMVSSPSADESRSPPSGRPKLWIYVVMADPDGHHARAVAAGASIIAAPHDNDYGGRGYEVRDSEDNIWSFGSYDPWATAG
jgi:uncharacterized glyoxalase superfamily protein PhnB